jgi:ABC-type multidrug transport system fused ATPase/permease subunit
VLAPPQGTHPEWFSRWLVGVDAGWIVAGAAVAVLALTVINGALAYTATILSQVAGQKVVAAIRQRLFAHTQRLPQSWHDYRETGDVMARLTGDVQLVEELLVSSVITFASQAFLILGMLGVMFWLDPLLGLAAVSIAPLFVFAAFSFSGRIKSAARKQRTTYGKIVDSIQETLAGIAHVKSFGQEEAREEVFTRSADRDVRTNIRTARLEAKYQRTVEMLNALGTCLVLGLGAMRVRAGVMTPGDLLIYLSYLRRLYRPLQRVARASTKSAKATVRGEKILEVFALPTEPRDAAHSPEEFPETQVQGEVRFENVSFSYSKGAAVLHDVSCTMPPGKTTLVLGATGAGKSTMAKLLLRFYEPASGRIRLDGRDIRTLAIPTLRHLVTPLAQDTFLFRTSIAENIAFGRRHAKREEIEAAAAFVGADAFIRRLQNGYDTLVGEGGLTLSGGQRQWITFARAALRQSPVMVFDEPATGLDVHAEVDAKRALTKLGSGRTLIVITHRLTFLDLADWVVFVSEGRVREEGTLEECIERRGDLYGYLARGREHLESLRWLDRLVQEGPHP